MLFSQREGFKPIKNVIQVKGMDNELRNCLWNALTFYYWDQMKGVDYIHLHPNIKVLLLELWHNYFKKPIDTLRIYWLETRAEIREYFFNCEWFEVYDFIEFIANNYPEESVNQDFMNFCNSVLEQELSAYRFVGGRITKITSKEEISEIEEALKITDPFKNVNVHLKRALDLLADRKKPDYRNSVKEAISAVEAICKLITKDKKATLGQALKEIEEKVNLHLALKSAFKNLYGYTSNAEGIRHALLDEPNLDFEDAKFMLVSCSAFVNYLISKSSKANIEI